MKVLIIGGAGFISSMLIRYLITETDHQVVNPVKLTYAGNLESLAEIVENPRCIFERLDICERPAPARVFTDHAPDAVMHFAVAKDLLRVAPPWPEYWP